MTAAPSDSRRAVLRGLAVSGLMVAAVSQARAQTKPGAAAKPVDHSAHGAAATAGGKSGHGAHGAKMALAAAAKKCQVAGDACSKHCIALISKGDVTLVDCLKAVAALVPVTVALERLAANNAQRLKDLARVAADVAADCEAECRKHEHPQCKACGDACVALINEIKTTLSA